MTRFNSGGMSYRSTTPINGFRWQLTFYIVPNKNLPYTVFQHAPEWLQWQCMLAFLGSPQRNVAPWLAASVAWYSGSVTDNARNPKTEHDKEPRSYIKDRIGLRLTGKKSNESLSDYLFIIYKRGHLYRSRQLELGSNNRISGILRVTSI